MRMEFVLAGITGSALAARYAAAINEADVGFCTHTSSNAAMSKDGATWTTYMSSFSYRILNPEAEKSAVVEYDGACRGFLRQNLLPQELRGETLSAKIIEGSAFERYGADKLIHTNARKLASAYELAQGCYPQSTSFDVCLQAGVSADLVREHAIRAGLYKPGQQDGTGVSVRAVEGVVRLTLTVVIAEELASVVVPIFDADNRSAERLISWMNRLRPAHAIAA